MASTSFPRVPRSPATSPTPDQLLADFARFWDTEPAPAERRKLLAQLFEHVWQDGGAIVAVTPREPFARYFTAAARTRSGARNGSGVKHGSDGTRTRDLCRDRAAL